MAVEWRLISWVETFCSGAKDSAGPLMLIPAYRPPILSAPAFHAALLNPLGPCPAPGPPRLRRDAPENSKPGRVLSSTRHCTP